jgi:hypothetical protein
VEIFIGGCFRLGDLVVCQCTLNSPLSNFGSSVLRRVARARVGIGGFSLQIEHNSIRNHAGAISLNTISLMLI